MWNRGTFKSSGTFVWLRVEPVSGTLWNMNFQEWNGTFMSNLREQLLRVEPLCGREPEFWRETFMWNLEEP